MPCTKCNSEFTLLNWKIKCGECESKFCNKCLKRKDGVLHCEVCLILIKRPPDPLKLMDLRVKDLRDYLNKNNISTYGLVEKSELVDLFCNKCIPEKQRKGVDKLTANFGDPLRPINGFLNNIESVITEHRHGSRPTTVPAPPIPRDPQTSSNFATPYHRPGPTPPQSTPLLNVTPAPSAPSFEPSPVEQPTTSQTPEITPESSPVSQRHPKLEDFDNAENLSELSSKQLKILLSFNRVEYRGCIEKGELLERAQRLWEDNNKNKDLPDNTPSEELCKLCMDAPLDCVLLDCGHITSCIECGKKLAECPICRRFVVKVVRTFKA
ncbi:unnamed protein product [Ceutorhynchus assimilis]|uniref:RING-type domain-containing protein n=1 Tax=Ceutorhynchus assimilis TaxID=467358 RepID=A0A9N9QGW0_9CUCU|nr:unnamed protein product [Ceutorhynchus assimilis]